jgi:hypothetical protein
MGKKLLFTSCKMFENVHFFAVAFKVCKKCYYFVKNNNISVKKAEFYADLKFVDADFNKWP